MFELLLLMLSLKEGPGGSNPKHSFAKALPRTRTGTCGAPPLPESEHICLKHYVRRAESLESTRLSTVSMIYLGTQSHTLPACSVYLNTYWEPRQKRNPVCI